MIEVIRSRDNSLVKRLVKLEGRPGEAEALLDGERLVRAYCDARIGDIALLAVGESALRHESVRTVFDGAPARKRAVLADRLLERVSQVVNSPGLVAVIDIPRPPAIPASVGDALLLDRIQDPGNLGSMLRSAQAAGMRDVFLSSGTVRAWSPKVLRAGMGAHFRLRIHEEADLGSLARRALGAVLATRADAPGTLFDEDLQGPVAWLFGNEGAGLPEELSAVAARSVAIPMPGAAESLNVAACAAVCLFEQLRQRLASRAAPGGTPA